MARAKAKREPPYLTLPDSAIRPLLEMGVLTLQAAVFLYMWSRRYDGDNGEILSAPSRAAIASALGVSESIVRQAVHQIRAKGAIDVVLQGNRGTATVYHLMPSYCWPLLKGLSAEQPNRDEKGYLAGTKGLSETNESAPKGLSGRLPQQRSTYKVSKKGGAAGAQKASGAPAQRAGLHVISGTTTSVTQEQWVAYQQELRNQRHN